MVGCRHGSRESLGIAVVSRDVSSPSLQKFQLSGRIILLRQNSSSLTVVFLTKQRESRFPTCVTSPLVLLHDWCCLAQSLSVYTFTNGGLLLISIKRFALGTPFRYLAMRFTFISSLSVGHVIFLAVSFVLYMMSARSWHMYSSFPTAVLYTARFSFSSSTSVSVVDVLFTLGVDTGLESFKPSTAITSRMYFGFASTGIHEPFSQSLCREQILSPSFSNRPTIRI